MTLHALDQLPLWVEGDLDAASLAAVEHHLAQCPDCASAAGDLRASQDLMRETMTSPFDASDRERLRRRVMAQVRTKAASRPVLRLLPRATLLAACAASLLLAILLGRQKPAVAIPELRPAPTAPHPHSPQPPPTMAVRRGLLPLRIREPAASPREAPHATRIEFQTADPTIRIIWLAQSKPLLDTTPSTEEKS